MVFGEWDMDTALEVAKEEGVESVFDLLDQGYTVEEAKKELQNLHNFTEQRNLLKGTSKY
ncbi:MAG: hypothetical protein Ta2B_24860 [Termitinemataceae bacterium]|nr:MAG: hypothetical protein Ta2B_24860 [Termitinemataceae bacterium]